MTRSKYVHRRRAIQWSLIPIVLVTIGLGWKFPYLGFTVPAVMLMGVIGGLARGRYVCGNLCPRGSFFDRMIAPMSRRKRIPDFLRNMPLRWCVFAGLMGLMIWRILQNPSDAQHWGRVFWLMCVVTTSFGVVLGLWLHPRTWCAFCPMGTLQNALGGGRMHLRIDPGCKECRTCEKACPIGLPIASYKENGIMLDRDCLQCPECIAVCPRDILSWPVGS